MLSAEMCMFQEDLRSGMSLEDTLTKYGLSLKEALDQIPLTVDHSPNSRYYCGEEYISARDGGYLIRKTLEGVHTYFGTYDSLDDAMKVRDRIIELGWNKSELDNECLELNVKRRVK